MIEVQSWLFVLVAAALFKISMLTLAERRERRVERMVCRIEALLMVWAAHWPDLDIRSELADALETLRKAKS